MSDVSTARKGRKDQFANVAYGSVTLSAANTLTFAQMQFAVGLFQGVGLLVHRLLWMPTANAVRELVAATDSMIFALTTSNRLASLSSPRDPSIICIRHLVGIAAATETYQLPIVEDYCRLPGGGKLVPANPIFLGSVSGGFAAAFQVELTMEFTFVELSDKDYLELIQAQFPANVA